MKTPQFFSTESGTQAILKHVLEIGCPKIWLPSDMCVSVVDAFKASELTFSFYEVQRKWKNASDRYLGVEQILPQDLMLVSDLFNFNSINWEDLPKASFLFDFAHCPVSAIFQVPLEFFPAFFIFSFGRGKYFTSSLKNKGALVRVYEKNGLEELLNNFMLSAELEKVSYRVPPAISELPKECEILDASESSRVVVRCKNALQIAAKLRTKYQLSISDGLFDYDLLGHREEFYVWKDKIK